MNIKKEILSNVTNLKTQERLIKDYDIYFLTYKDLFCSFLKIYSLCLLISVSFYRSFILSILLIPVALIYPFFTKKSFIEKRKRKLLDEFKDFLQVIKSNLEASYSIENSFEYAKNEIKMLYGDKSLMLIELENMCIKMHINVPIYEVFDEFANRAKVSDIKDFSDSLTVIKKMGGNINKTINDVIFIINEKMDVERDIALSTASKRFEQNIMSMLPFLIILYLNYTSYEFLEPLYNNFLGRLFMTALLGVYFLSVYLSKKILSIEV